MSFLPSARSHGLGKSWEHSFPTLLFGPTGLISTLDKKKPLESMQNTWTYTVDSQLHSLLWACNLYISLLPSLGIPFCLGTMLGDDLEPSKNGLTVDAKTPWRIFKGSLPRIASS